MPTPSVSQSLTRSAGTTNYTYNPVTAPAAIGAGRLATVDGPQTNDTIGDSYDELGRVVSRSLNSVTTTWAYDVLSRLTTITDPIGSFTYTYAGNSRRVSGVAYPNGQTTSYAYYPNSGDKRLQEIHRKKPDTSTLSKLTYGYDAVGNVTLWTQQNDASPANAYDFAYDSTDQLTNAVYRTTDPTPTVLKRYGYGYDPTGNRTAEQIDDAVTGATYDNMNRLVSQQPGGALLFRGTVSEPATVTVGGKPATVDAANNFQGSASVPSGTSNVVVTATDASGNLRTNTYQIGQTGTSSSFTYDANGNLTGDGTKTYEWDAEDRLTAVKQGGATLASFTYDGSGRRATKTAGSVTTTNVYDGSSVVEERPSSGVAARYVYGLGIDQPFAQIKGATLYYAADHLGSVVRMTDSTGAPTWTRQYDPWGNLIQGASTSGFAFTGREWDSEIGLYYYRARYYSQSAGRFLSEDPIARWEESAYAYVDNNPINGIDPSGLFKVPPLPPGTKPCGPTTDNPGAPITPPAPPPGSFCPAACQAKQNVLEKIIFFCSKPPGSPPGKPPGIKVAGWAFDQAGNGAAFNTPTNHQAVDHCRCVHEASHVTILQGGVTDTNMNECIAYLVNLACLDQFCPGR